MKAFGMVGEEIEDPPILLDVGLGVGFEGMNHVRKLEAIADEEDREVVSHKVEVTLSSVEFHSETSGIPEGFRAATFVDNSGETDDERGLNSRGSEEIGTCEVRNVMRDFKETLCASSTSVDNTFGDPFPVKVCKLLHQMVILQQNWTCMPQFNSQY